MSTGVTRQIFFMGELPLEGTSPSDSRQREQFLSQAGCDLVRPTLLKRRRGRSTICSICLTWCAVPSRSSTKVQGCANGGNRRERSKKCSESTAAPMPAAGY